MIYPPEFPAHIDEPAEHQVYKILSSIDRDRYDVYYHQRFSAITAGESGEYEIDFIIAELSKDSLNAILVIEVKGGVVKYDGVKACWTQNGKTVNADPVSQAQGNMHNLVKHYQSISNKVPFGWAVCFPDPRNIYSSKQIPQFINPVQLIESSALYSIEKHLPVLFGFIKQQHPYLKGIPQKTYSQLKASLLCSLGHVIPLHNRLIAEDQQLIRLTNEQMELLNIFGDNSSLLITGPAGCGKTIMATTIARRSREEGLNVLLLTFNRIPAANIRLGFGLGGDEKDLTIDNYHHFAHMQIEAVDPGWWEAHIDGGDDFWQLECAAKLDEVLRNNEPLYDVLIIDEGQDFRELWYESLLGLLKQEARMYVFMDEDQDIFRAFTRLPKSRSFSKFNLPHNCRNTNSIIDHLEKYIEKPIPRRKETPLGESVKFYYYHNDIEQVKILKQEWLRLVIDEQINPGKIVIIMNTHWESGCLAKVKNFDGWPIAPISKETGYISPKHVNITTIREFKGLEADVVFLIDTDKMITDDKRIMYTQASRARLWLGIFELQSR